MCEFLVDCIIEQYVSVLRVLCFVFFLTEIYFENDASVVNCFYVHDNFLLKYVEIMPCKFQCCGVWR